MKLFKGQIEWKDGYTIKTFSTFFRVYDANGNLIYGESSNGYWIKKEYDEHGNRVYYENSEGKIIDNRKVTIELTQEQLNKIKHLL